MWSWEENAAADVVGLGGGKNEAMEGDKDVRKKMEAMRWGWGCHRYAAIAGNNVVNGAMAANVLGDAVLSFSVFGPDYNYSSGYIFIRGVGGALPPPPDTWMFPSL